MPRLIKVKKEDKSASKILSRVETEIEHLKDGQEEIKQMLADKYVTHDEFSPIKLIVYGMVGTILLSVLGAIIALVIKSSS